MNALTYEDRVAILDGWRSCTASLTGGYLLIEEMPDLLKEELREVLRDIPMRDAIIAEIARNEGDRGSARAMLTEVAANGDVPSTAILAALDFLEGDFDSAGKRVNHVLETEEYSFARLLRNGLDMRAPASMLQRSLTHFDPDELIRG